MALDIDIHTIDALLPDIYPLQGEKGRNIYHIAAI
jgi:hypothetical protein